VIHINKESLEKLIQDVEQQLQKNTERLNHHLSKNERNQILAENQAIGNTINKLKNDLKGADDVGDTSYMLEVKGEPPQQRFTQTLNVTKTMKKERDSMELEKFTEELEAFMLGHSQSITEYNELEKVYKDEVRKQLRGAVQADGELEQKRIDLSAKLRAEGDRLKAKLEEIRVIELEKIEESQESVTADIVAELDLLSKMELTQDDVRGYIKKYRRNPLALQRLKEIARGRKELLMVMNEFPRDRKDYLNTVLGRMQSSIGRFSYPDYHEYDTKRQMIAEMNSKSHAEDVVAYRKL
jgi:hypothetical protein